MRTLLLGVLLWAHAAIAAAPQTGIWWNPGEGGRGYSIDVQGNTLVLISYAYGTDGRMQWYYADGPLLNGGDRWSGTLFRFDFGQPLNGPYTPPVNVGTSGVATIDFSTRTRGVLTLPGGRQSSIERYNFGVGLAPNALLGDWVYVYTIGATTFAERFRYTLILSATANGNGVVATASGDGGAELQTSGLFAGSVFAVNISSTGAILDQYIFTPYLEEGRGFWISTVTNQQFGLNAYRIANISGIVKSVATDGDPAGREKERLAAEMMAKRTATRLDDLQGDPEVTAIAREIVGRLMEHRRSGTQ
jgi:hypothetical protein